MVKAGAQRLTFQVEDGGMIPPRAAQDLKTRLQRWHHAEHRDGGRADSAGADFTEPRLIMSVVPDLARQKFMPKFGECEWSKKRLRADQSLEIDGGLNRRTLRRRAKRGGVDWS